MNILKTLVILSLIFQLGGCVPSYSLVKTERINSNNTYSVYPKTSWNQLKQDKITIWTANGVGLDRIVFINNINDGETIFGDDKTSEYKNDMSEIEIADLFMESMKNAGKWPNGNFDNLKLQKFGPFDGFNFDLILISEEGLSYKGVASGAVIKDELYLMFFLATKLHFYDSYHDKFQNIISSIKKL